MVFELVLSPVRSVETFGAPTALDRLFETAPTVQRRFRLSSLVPDDVLRMELLATICLATPVARVALRAPRSIAQFTAAGTQR